MHRARREIPRGPALVCRDHGLGSSSLLEAVSLFGLSISFRMRDSSCQIGIYGIIWESLGALLASQGTCKPVQGLGFEVIRDGTARIGGRQPKRPEGQLARGHPEAQPRQDRRGEGP